jgi:hypothetical protein
MSNLKNALDALAAHRRSGYRRGVRVAARNLPYDLARAGATEAPLLAAARTAMLDAAAALEDRSFDGEFFEAADLALAKSLRSPPAAPAPPPAVVTAPVPAPQPERIPTMTDPALQAAAQAQSDRLIAEANDVGLIYRVAAQGAAARPTVAPGASFPFPAPGTPPEPDIAGNVRDWARRNSPHGGARPAPTKPDAGDAFLWRGMGAPPPAEPPPPPLSREDLATLLAEAQRHRPDLPAALQAHLDGGSFVPVADRVKLESWVAFLSTGAPLPDPAAIRAEAGRRALAARLASPGDFGDLLGLARHRAQQARHRAQQARDAYRDSLRELAAVDAVLTRPNPPGDLAGMIRARAVELVEAPLADRIQEALDKFTSSFVACVGRVVKRHGSGKVLAAVADALALDEAPDAPEPPDPRLADLRAKLAQVDPKGAAHAALAADLGRAESRAATRGKALHDEHAARRRDEAEVVVGSALAGDPAAFGQLLALAGRHPNAFAPDFAAGLAEAPSRAMREAGAETVGTFGEMLLA